MEPESWDVTFGEQTSNTATIEYPTTKDSCAYSSPHHRFLQESAYVGIQGRTMSSKGLQAVSVSVNRPSNPSRRRFLTTLAGSALSVALGYYALTAANDADYASRPSRDFSRVLDLRQTITKPVPKRPAVVEVKYPGLYPVDLDFQVEITNNADIPLEGLVIEQYGADGLELKRAEIDALAMSPSQVENGLRLEAPEKSQPGHKLTLNLFYKTGWDSVTCEVKARAKAVAQYYDVGGFLPLLPFGLGDPHEGHRLQEVNSESDPLTITIVPDPIALKELHLQGKEDWLRTIQDGKLLLLYPLRDEFARDEYWRNPSVQNARRVLEAFYSEFEDAGDPYARLPEELERLPDLGQTRYDEKALKSVENIAHDALLYSAKEQIERMIRTMLDEGIKGKRKYCSALEAWFWLASEEVPDETRNPSYSIFQTNALLRFSSVPELVRHSWRYSSASAKYTSDKWKDFEVVVDRLNSPRLLWIYMSSNFAYSTTTPWRDIPPEMVFRMKRGDCWTQHAFAMYVLTKNGYEAYLLGVDWYDEYTLGHKVCMYKEGDDLFFLDNTLWAEVALGSELSGIFGPFRNIEEAASKVLLNCKIFQARPYPGKKYVIHLWNSRKQLIKTIPVGS